MISSIKQLLVQSAVAYRANLHCHLPRCSFANISMDLVKRLREETGSPITECKKALEQNSGDIEQAREFLKQRGLASAQKRLTKDAREGVVGVLVHPNRKFAAIAEINCETDFVARTDLFLNFVNAFLETVVSNQQVVDCTIDQGENQSSDKLNEYLKKQLAISVIPE